MKKVVAIVLFLILVAGCIPAAIVYTAHKVSEAKTESAEKVQRSTDLATYARYRIDMEKVNLDREKAGLKPNQIMSQEDWQSAQTAGRAAVAPSK